jgi:hypothetical protein
MAFCYILHTANLKENVYYVILLKICTVATTVKAMCQYWGAVTVCHSNPHCHYISVHCYYISAHCYKLLNCTVATVQLLYAIRILTVTISVHTVTNMYGSHSTVTVCNSNYHCHYISAQCYQYVRQPQLCQMYKSVFNTTRFNPRWFYILSFF